MAPFLFNLYENSFFFLKDLNRGPQSIPSVARSSHNRQDCLTDAAASDATKRPWYNEHASSTMDTRHHGIFKSTSPEMFHDSVGNSRLNKAQHERGLPPRSPTSGYAQSFDIPTMPSAIARDPRRKTGWLKALAQREQDQKRRQGHISKTDNILVEAEKGATSMVIGPERKQIALVKEEDRKCSREDRIGIPHYSELQADDDTVASFTVEELCMGGEAEVVVKPLHDCNATAVCDLGSDRQQSQ